MIMNLQLEYIQASMLNPKLALHVCPHITGSSHHFISNCIRTLMASLIDSFGDQALDNMYQTALHAAAANDKPEAWMVNPEPMEP